MWLTKILFLLALGTLALSQTAFNEKNNITQKDPNFPFTGEMFTGFIVIDNNTEANLYYHLFAYNQTTLTTPAPLIIWFQGGPGCSSSEGNYGELGPVKILQDSQSSNFTYERNPDTWNNYAHLLFIDQPTGSGFSRDNGLNVSSTSQASQNFQVFLARFYQIYPELTSSALYLFGESYAGKYVPTFSYDLLQNKTFTSQIKIGGIGVGDGWSDPLKQIPTYGTFGYAAGIIDAQSRDNLRMQEVQATIDILSGNYYQATGISNGILDNLSALAGGVSEYDYRVYDSDDDPFIGWLNTTQAQNFLGIPYESFSECNPDVSDDFTFDNTHSVADLYPQLFEEIPVLLYNGQDDDNCDYEGVVNYINSLNWTDIKNFRKSERVPWVTSDGTTAGLVKSYKNFTFLLVLKAGHMVPAYQPKVSAEMVYNFLNGIPFDSKKSI